LNAIGRDIPAFELSDVMVDRIRAQPDDIIVGSPRKVTEQLMDQAKASGTGNILFFTDFRLFKHADLARSHELIGREVVPVLKNS
jgi:alkanesulfonate monooxygenase SsuD/methylene tetrahydromethanopterin reductase-like flavin-dependent oxidoreductase (luciferase family)